MNEALNEIEAALCGLQRVKLLAALRFGTKRDTVRRELATLGLPPNGDLESLYNWRDGTETEGSTIGDIYLFPGYYFISLEEAVENYRSFVHDERWDKNWFPFLADGGGDFYVLDCSHGSAHVRHFWIDDTTHPIEYTSIASMVETIRRAYAEKVIFVDNEGNLEMDDAAFYSIATELNPTLAYWSEPERW